MCIERQRGLTMIELIIFIVIIGVAVGGMLGVLAHTTSQSADPLQRKQAMLVAEALLEEVSLAKFTFCHPTDAAAETAAATTACATTALRENYGRQVAGTRPYFNINDYVTAANAWTSFTPGDSSGLITDIKGGAMVPGPYRARVKIAPAALGPAGMVIGSAAAASADNDVLHIAVEVTYGNNQRIVLDRYRTRYAPNSMP